MAFPPSKKERVVIKRTCVYCKQDFERIQGSKPVPKYCSNDCRLKGSKADLFRYNNHQPNFKKK
jgi:hypothetical protein